MILSIFLAGEYVIKTDHWCLGRDLLILQLFGWSCKTEKWECDLLLKQPPGVRESTARPWPTISLLQTFSHVISRFGS